MFHSKKRYSPIVLLFLLLIIVILSGCGENEKNERNPLDPSHPVSITLWHYHNSSTKRIFDELTDEFNSTVGKKQGVYVNALSQGDVSQLADSIYDTVENKIGSSPLPNMCFLYPDNALRINRSTGLVDLEKYFTRDELALYNKDFLEDGRIGNENRLLVFPISKSSENLFLSGTDWDTFSAVAGTDRDSLSTWEGILAVAERYYEWTDSLTAEPDDGKIFFGIDSPYNFILMTSKQMGRDMFIAGSRGKGFLFDEELARLVWDNFYVPSLKGYYGRINRYCSDDVKTGLSIAYVGSTAGAGSFPSEAAHSLSNIYPITCEVLPYPVYEHGVPYAPLRGAGISVFPGDTAHEYASALFLKWFTEPKQNAVFAASTGYMPVKDAALNRDVLLAAVQNLSAEKASCAVADSVQTTFEMLDSYVLYSEKPFDGSHELKLVVENFLIQRLESELAAIEAEMRGGALRADALRRYVSDAAFSEWRRDLLTAANTAVQ